MDIDLAGFQLWLARDGRKASTIRLHTTNLKKIAGSCTVFTELEIERALLLFISNGNSARYVNIIIGSINLYARWANIVMKIKDFKEKEYIRATLSDIEIEAFLSLPPETKMIKHARSGKMFPRQVWVKQYNLNTLYFTILAYTGMRTGECANLTVNDIDFGRSVFIITDTKTNEPRFVPIPAFLVPKLQARIADCPGRLFPGMDDVDWNYNFHKRINRLGIKRTNLTPYSLRHSFITRMLEEDINLFKVQKIVGHHRIETTAHYTHLTTKDMIRTIEKDPLSRNKLDGHLVLESIKEYLSSLHLDYEKFSITYENDRVEIKLK
jgi:integrase